MKAIATRISAGLIYAKTLEWGKLISITGFAQIGIQGIGFVSGILIIRLLPTHEYALYILATNMLGTMTMVADGGVSTGVFSQAGNVWKDRSRLGSVLTTGINLRNKMALSFIFLLSPVFLYLLRHQDVDWGMAILLLISLIMVFASSTYSTIIDIPHKLRQDITPLQLIQLFATLGRLFICLILFIFPWAFVAMLATFFPQILANRKVKHISYKYVDLSQSSDSAIKKSILSIVKKMLPTSVYHSISGQLSVWVISIYGTTTAIAQIGALGRLAIVITLVNVLFNTIMTPRIARMPNVPQMLFQRYLQVLVGLFVLCSLIFAVTWLFSTELLWVLGSKYSGLEEELTISMFAACLSVVTSFNFLFSSSRGWAISPFLYIPISVLSIVVGVLIFDVSSVKGVLLYNLFITAIQTVLFFGFSLSKIVKNLSSSRL